MLIQVDVDSTLYDSNKLFYEQSKEFNIDWPATYYNWFGPEEIGTDLVTLKNLFRRCHGRECVMDQDPYPRAAQTLARIAKTLDDVEIVYVSDRNEQQTGALRDWLDMHGFLYSKDQTVLATKDKRHWMREHKPEIVIDDRVRTVLMAWKELNSKCVVFEHPHNINLRGEAEGIYVCKDWDEIDKTLWEILDQSRPLSHEKELARR